MKAIELKNVTKRIKGKNVLSNITFGIEEGTIVGLVGINGAGKSTLLKTIVGLVHPTSGTIKINGYDIKKQYEKAISKVGCIIEMPIMYEYLSGRDNLDIYKIMFKNVSEERVNEIIKLISLEKSQYKKLKIYSLGMKQRLGLGLSLINNPKLLILDEPTNGLDPLGIKELRSFLKSLKNTTILISSHMLSEIENICDQVIFINNGKIVDIKNLKNKKYRLYVNDKEKTRQLLSSYNVSDKLVIHTTKKEMLNIGKILSSNDIKLLKVSEETQNLEEEFLSLIGNKDV